MTVDITNAIALVAAYLDEDPPGLTAIVDHTDAPELVLALTHLCLQLGQHLYGDKDGLRDALADAMTRDIQQHPGDATEGGTP